MATSKKKTEPVEDAPVVEPVDEVSDVVEVDEPAAPEFVPPKVWEPKRPESIVVTERDTYASIGVQWAPKGVSGVEFAREVHRANLGASLYPGKVVRLPR